MDTLQSERLRIANRLTELLKIEDWILERYYEKLEDGVRDLVEELKLLSGET